MDKSGVQAPDASGMQASGIPPATRVLMRDIAAAMSGMLPVRGELVRVYSRGILVRVYIAHQVYWCARSTRDHAR